MPPDSLRLSALQAPQERQAHLGQLANRENQVSLARQGQKVLLVHADLKEQLVQLVQWDRPARRVR